MVSHSTSHPLLTISGEDWDCWLRKGSPQDALCKAYHANHGALWCATTFVTPFGPTHGNAPLIMIHDEEQIQAFPKYNLFVVSLTCIDF